MNIYKNSNQIILPLMSNLDLPLANRNIRIRSTSEDYREEFYQNNHSGHQDRRICKYYNPANGRRKCFKNGCPDIHVRENHYGYNEGHLDEKVEGHVDEYKRGHLEEYNEGHIDEYNGGPHNYEDFRGESEYHGAPHGSSVEPLSNNQDPHRENNVGPRDEPLTFDVKVMLTQMVEKRGNILKGRIIGSPSQLRLIKDKQVYFHI